MSYRDTLQLMVETLQSPHLLLCHGLSCRAQVGALGQVTNFYDKYLSYKNISKELGFKWNSWEQGEVSFEGLGREQF